MKRFAVLGFPVEHSQSPAMFGQWWDESGLHEQFDYEKINLDPHAFIEFINNEGRHYEGLNITIPHKQVATNHCDVLSDAARAIGAVNAMTYHQGQWHGDNTDASGFWSAIESQVPDRGQAIIMGNGGAARAVHYALSSRGWDILTLVRTPKPDYPGIQQDFESVIDRAIDLVVQCTPLGMAPHFEQHPPLPQLNSWSDVLVVDLIYNPSVTKFMSLCNAQSAQSMNGYAMLQAQGKKAWEFWRNLKDLPHI